MPDQDWENLKQIFHVAITLVSSERAAYLDRACKGDISLRQAVDSLIASHENGSYFVDKPAYQAAANMLIDDLELNPGQIVSHYRILSVLGEGGMGKVYLAEDTKLDRKVALKVLPRAVAAHPDRMRRFVQEAKAASALNHPNIITIHEINETTSGQFIATEFIEGETLREREQRPVTLVEAVELATQIATALEAAHHAAIVHRDIKPENIMIRRDGIVKVLDFGLAKLAPKDTGPEDATVLRTGSGLVMGTISYMSPEQARGQAVDARTDIWSLGVVLYEMVAGRLPFAGPTNSDVLVSILEREPKSLTMTSSTVTDELQRIVGLALCKDREERYKSVRDLLIDLKTLKEELQLREKLPHVRNQDLLIGRNQIDHIDKTDGLASDNTSRKLVSTSSQSNRSKITRKKTLISIVLGMLLIVATGVYFLFASRRSTLTEKDTILLGDFVNTTGDKTFDGATLKQALAVQLRQTPFLNLFPEESVRETLRYMGQHEDERITPQVGREICRRRGLKALLVGTIASFGRNYAITLEAINGQTGETIASQQIEAEGKEQVLKSLGHAALELRKQLGESLGSLQKYDAPIEQATTSSLEALNVYSKGLEQIYSGNYRDALPLFNKAVELDPNFAEGYVWLSWTWSNLGDYAKTASFAEKAYALRDRVTELEKLHIDEIYHIYTTGDFEKQKEADELIARLYPNDFLAHGSLALVYNIIGQHEKALAESREAIRLNPNEVHLYWLQSWALISLNRFDEAREVIEQGQGRKLDDSGYRRHLHAIAFVQHDGQAMQQQLELMRKRDGEDSAIQTEASTALFEGRWRDAQRLFKQVTKASAQSNTMKEPSSLPPEALIAGALFGFCPSTADINALAGARLSSPFLIIFLPIQSDGSLCGDTIQAQSLVDEQAKRYPQSIHVNVFSIPIVRALVALRRNEPDQAIEYLKEVAPYKGGHAAFWPSYIRGQAYLRLHRSNEAAAEFQTILDHRGWEPLSPMYPVAHLGLARALSLAGDKSGSRKSYEDFFAVWKDADSDLPIMVEAKKEYGSLR